MLEVDAFHVGVEIAVTGAFARVVPVHVVDLTSAGRRLDVRWTAAATILDVRPAAPRARTSLGAENPK